VADITAGHFFAGVIGSSLLRQWYVSGEFNSARMAELSALLAELDRFPHSLALNPDERDLETGYAEWAAVYDGPNPLIEAEEPNVHPILRRLGGPGVRALDAACGTGRHASFLVELGCDTVGVDRSEAMLARAREKVPAATFEHAELTTLPFADGSFDLATVSLALCHLADPAPAIAELARVLRTGGRLVITDPHPMGNAAGGQAFYGGITPGKPMTWVRNHYHGASTWLGAFRAAGLIVEECHEPPVTDEQIASMPASTFFPDAARALLAGTPTLWVWVVRRT
jgi:ubiquinone/menaquinone biosynthesis C-methylase UbiE